MARNWAIRRLLKQKAAPPRRIGDLMISYFGPENGVDLELPPREPHEPIDLTSEDDR